MRHFVAVAEELHFGRAAARLNMAQPPLSQSIRRLEDGLGFALLERSSRRVALTPAGRVFLDEAKRTLAQAEATLRLARQVASDELAELTLGFVSAALYRVLPEALRTFRTRFPEIRIRLEELSTERQLESLRDGGIDIAFLHPPLRDAVDLEVQVVDRDPFVAAVPTGSPLAKTARLALGDLADQDFVLFPYRRGPSLYRGILTACRQAGFAPKITQEAQRMHTILSLVAAEMGVSLVPQGAQTLRIDGVAFVQVDGIPQALAWELAMVRRKTDRRRALLRFAEMIGQRAAPAQNRPRTGGA